MSTQSPASLRTLAFGALHSDLWGVVWTGTESTAVAWSGATSADDVDVDNLELTTLQEYTIAYEPDKDGDGDAPAPVTARICQVRGQIAVGGAPTGVDCLGLEVTQAAPVLAEIDSFRQVLAWFAEDDALSVSSARPRKFAGQDRDELLTVMIEPDGPLAIDEARLSTTYGAGGQATRMSLELWTPEENEDSYPRRAAGEVMAAPATVRMASTVLDVHPMLCHRAGRDGPGIYVIARAANGEGR